MAIPSNCPSCGASYSELMFSGTMDHRVARQLQRFGPLLSLVMPIVFLAWALGPGGLLETGRGGWGFGFGFGLIAVLVGPSLLVYVISLFFPSVRHVHCHSCGWDKEVRVSR